MKVFNACTHVPSAVQPKLNAHALLKTQVPVGGVLRYRFSIESDHPSLNKVVGFPYFAVSPEHAQAVDRFECRTQPISPNIGDAWLLEDGHGQNFSYIIHACPDELSPRVPVI